MLVYSYMRFSDPRQAAGHSAERQAAYAAKWAAEHGMRLDESLSLRDEGLSAYHQQHVARGALGAFLAAVEQGRILPGSVLVVEGLDRLSRAEPIQAQAQLAQIINAGISVVTATDGRVYSRQALREQPMDLVYSLLVMIRAHEESATKSKRVSDAIARQCRSWQAGTWRGKIRSGKDPQWVRETPAGWELIPARAEAVRTVVQLYLSGHSAASIVQRLAATGMQISNGGGTAATHVYKVIRNPALLGTKRVSIASTGEEFELAGYWPAIIDDVTWSELQAAASQRGRRAGSTEIPHIVTGMGITRCGYCGKAMSGQNLLGKVRAGGKMQDGYRRLLCASLQYGAGRCPHPKSRSVAPLERAIMSYCSDLANLRSLYPTDRSLEPRARLAKLRAELAELDAQEERLMSAMLATGADGTPAMFARRARDIEAGKAALASKIAAAEHDLAVTTRSQLEGTEARWSALAAGVAALDKDARLLARQLIGDTFAQIVVYASGVRPGDTPPGEWDVLLLARGGTGRLLHLDHHGSLIWAETADSTVTGIGSDNEQQGRRVAPPAPSKEGASATHRRPLEVEHAAQARVVAA